MITPAPQDRATMGQFLRNKPQKYVLNFNTFVHGFYSPRYAFAPTATIVQQKKYPDVSFYQGVINWDMMRGMTDAVIIRAGQRNYVDTQFVRNWAESKARGMLRGVYWFYDGRMSPTAQADYLVSLIRYDLPEMEIIFDWETNYGGMYEGLPNVVAMMKRVEALLPGKQVAMYTGYYWFIQNSNPITHAAEYTYLKTKGLHLAWYTNDASLVKVPQPWSSIYLWQFGTPTEGAQYGCITPTIDMNYFNGTLSEFAARYGVTVTPPIGYGYTKTRINNSDVHIVKLQNFARAHVTKNSALTTVSSAAKSKAAKYAINGDGWANNRPLSLASSNGDLYNPVQFDGRPFINITSDGTIKASTINDNTSYNLVSGTRWSVKAGVNVFANDTDPEHVTELHPRSAIGYTADNKIILCVVDGRSATNRGVTLKELSTIMIEAGAWYAVEMDGGGSSALFVTDRIVNVPSDGAERAVINHLLLFEGAPMRYTATAIANNTKTRPNHNTLTDFNPSRYHPAGAIFSGDVLWIADAGNKDASQYVGDTWLQIGASEWVAVTHRGTKICTLVDNGTPPPATPSIYISHTFTDSLAVTQADGTVKNYNANFTVPNVEYKPQP